VLVGGTDRIEDKKKKGNSRARKGGRKKEVGGQFKGTKNPFPVLGPPYKARRLCVTREREKV